MRRRVRTTVGAVLLAAATLLMSPGTAQAIPPAGPNQSVTYTFYSDRFKTTEVGWWSYGYCGEPFDFGTHTNYYTITYVNC